MEPLISVVTVVLNDAEGFRKTARSVAGQDYPRLEFLVVDGGSDDATLQAIGEFSSSVRTWITGTDRGIYDAMNKGAGMACGEWTLFLNAGDALAGPDVISEIFRTDRGEADVLFGDAIAEYPGFQVYRKAEGPESLWKGMPFCHQAMFTRTGLLKKFPFDLRYAIGADYDLVYRLARAGAQFRYISLPICTFGTSGLSNRRHLRSWRERFDIYRTYGPLTLPGVIRYLLLLMIFAGTTMAYRTLPPGWTTRLVRWRNRSRIVDPGRLWNPDPALR